MRFFALSLVAVATLAACGGDKDKKADSTAAAAPAAAAPADTTKPAAPAGAMGTMAAITGKTHEVKMVGDDKGYRFEPAALTIKKGDGVKFIMVTGGPHNVAFDPAGIPAGAKTQLDANMGTDKMGELSSALKMNPNDAVTVSFANVPAGQYNVHCTPHLAMNMKAVITVQ